MTDKSTKEQQNTGQKKTRPGGQKATDSKYTVVLQRFIDTDNGGVDAKATSGKHPAG